MEVTEVRRRRSIHRTRRTASIAAVLTAGALFVPAGHAVSTGAADLPRPSRPFPTASPATAGAMVREATAEIDTTITIRTSGTNLEFTPARVSAKHGTRVTIRYVNEGTLPHNFVLVKDEDDIDTLGQAAFQAKETGYVPLEHKDRMIAWTALASPGDTVEVTFEMPPPGEYLFVCMYPGHYNMMIGTLRSLH
jgi:plastocyanin